MNGRKQIRRSVYSIVLVDFVALCLVIVLIAAHPAYLAFAVVAYAVVMVGGNFLFLRRKFKHAETPYPGIERGKQRPRRFSLYATSAVFLAGALYGLVLFLNGDVPIKLLPILLIPLSLAIYILRTARQVGRNSGKSSN